MKKLTSLRHRLDIARRSRQLVFASMLALGFTTFASFVVPLQASAATAPSVFQCLMYRPTLKKGVTNQGGCVTAVQGFYNYVADEKFVVSIDGLYGNQTALVTAAYQRDHRIAIDGIVGSHTWAQIEKDCDRTWATIDTCANAHYYYPG